VFSLLLSMVRLVVGSSECMFLISVLMLDVSICLCVLLRKVCSGLGLVSVVLNFLMLLLFMFVS